MAIALKSDARSRATAVALLVSVLVGVALTFPDVQLVLAAVVVATTVLVVVRAEFTGLVVASVWALTLIHLAKRAIFLVGPHPSWVYYAIQLSPSLLLIGAVISGRKTITDWPSSAKVLGVFAMLALFETLSPTSGVPTPARLAAVHQRLEPMLGLVLGLALAKSADSARRVLRALIWAAVASVPYGLVQVISGPTALDRDWATATSGYSIQAEKVAVAIQAAPGTADWRGFSYFADPLTWGLLLLSGLAAVLCLRSLAGRRAGWPSILVLLTGLFLSLTRTPWIGLVSMIGFYVLIHLGVLRTRRMAAALLIVAFAVVIWVGTFLFTQVYPSVGNPSVSNAAAQRYLTLGTAEARIGAARSLVEASKTNPIMGHGFAYSIYYSNRFGSDAPDVSGHNFLVETTVAVGVLGTACLVLFLLLLLGEGFRAGRKGSRVVAAHWLTAFVAGSIVTGYLTAGNFLNFQFFLFAGLLSGSASWRGVEHGADQLESV